MKLFNYSLIMLITCLFLNACTHKSSAKKIETLVITQKSVLQPFVFASQFSPITQTPIFSAIDGNLIAQAIPYGTDIKQGTSIFTISSTSLKSDLAAKIMEYIKAKTEYAHNLRMYHEALFLHQHQLIADNDLNEKKENLSLSLMTLQEATLSLMQLTTSVHLTFDFSQSADAWFHLLHTLPNTFSITANASGVLLPRQYHGESKQWEMGDPIKTNDVLGYIGNTNGYRLAFQVGEEMVNTLHDNDPVIITGPAFHGKLIGKITGINKVGESSNEKPPTFTITVTAPPQPLLMIHIGMSATMMITTIKPKAIYIPFTALHEINHQYYVSLLTEKNIQKEILVTPGDTTPTQVMILHGLKTGDRIITHD